MANFITRQFSAGAGNLAEAVGNAVDKNSTTDEERLEQQAELAKASTQHDLEMARLGVEEKKLRYGDLDSARQHQGRVQEAAHASWLAKNVHPLLAMSIIGSTFVMYFFIISGSRWIDLQNNNMKDIIIYILGALTTVSTQVASYFYGSSQGSKDSQAMLHDMASKSMQRGVRRNDRARPDGPERRSR